MLTSALTPVLAITKNRRKAPAVSINYDEKNDRKMK